MRSILTLSVLLSCTAAVPAQWVKANPAVSPSYRRAGAMEYDGIGNRLLMYGGTSPSPSTVLNETWSYTTTWSSLFTVAPPRWGHRMARNTVTNRILTFGGRSPTISGLNNDTMEWTGSNWFTVPTPNRPSPRFLYGLCFDSSREVYVMFGGRTATQGTIAETWEFNGVTWTQVATATTPPAREEMLMVYDTSLNRVVMFGGCNDNTDTILGDTWLYDGNDWALVLGANCPGCPAPRVRMASAFDSKRKRTILFGGYAEVPGAGRQIVTDTWEFGGDAWVQVSSPNAPTNATETYHAFHPVTGKFVVFGGFGGSFSDETWEYTGAAGGLFSTYGEGCETSVGEPTLASATTPTIGSTLILQYGNLPSDADAVLVVLGVSNTNWMGIPLPLDLGVIGLPGCDLLAAADVLEVAANFGTSAIWPLPIPNQTNLLNLSIYTQGIVLDLDPFVFLGTTPGGRALLGN